MVDGSGSFKHLRKLFPTLLRHNPHMSVLTTFTPDNIEFLADGIRRLHEDGFSVFYPGPDLEVAWEESDFEEVKKQYGQLAKIYREAMEAGHYLFVSLLDAKINSHVKIGAEICSCCDKNDGEIAVAPSGNLYPCLRFVKQDDDPKLCLGNVQTRLDRKKRARIMMDAARECADCLTCALRGRCFHYCSAVNFKTTETFNRPPEALCRLEQLAIQAADEMAKDLYERKVPMFLRRYFPSEAPPQIQTAS